MKTYLAFDAGGRITAVQQDSGINPAPPGFTDFSGSADGILAARRPREFFRNPNGNLEPRRPVTFRFSKRVLDSGGPGITVELLGIDRPTRIRIRGEALTVAPGEKLTLKTIHPGRIRVEVHEDEVDLFTPDRGANILFARRKPDVTPNPGPGPGPQPPSSNPKPAA